MNFKERNYVQDEVPGFSFFLFSFFKLIVKMLESDIQDAVYFDERLSFGHVELPLVISIPY